MAHGLQGGYKITTRYVFVVSALSNTIRPTRMLSDVLIQKHLKRIDSWILARLYVVRGSPAWYKVPRQLTRQLRGPSVAHEAA